MVSAASKARRSLSVPNDLGNAHLFQLLSNDDGEDDDVHDYYYDNYLRFIEDLHLH